MTSLGYRDCGWPEDYDLLLRLFATGARMGVVPRRLVAWRDGAVAACGAAIPPTRRNVSSPARRSTSPTGPLRHADDYVLWGYGETGRALRRALAALGKRAAWIVEVHPRRLGKTIHGAKVVRPERIPSLPKLPLVASVAGVAARDRDPHPLPPPRPPRTPRLPLRRLRRKGTVLEVTWLWTGGTHSGLE